MSALPASEHSFVPSCQEKNLTGEGCSVIWRTKEAGNSCHPEQPLNNQFNKLEVNCWCNAEFIGNSKEVCTSVQGDMKQAQKRSWWQACTGTCAGTGTGKKTDLLTDRQTDRQRKFQAYVVHYIVWTFTHVYGRHQSKTKVKNQLYSSTFENNRDNWKKGCSGTRLKYRSCWSGSVLNQGQRNSLDDLNLAHSLPVPSTYGSSINSKLTFLLQEVNNLVKSASFVLRVMSMIDRQPVTTYQQILFERSSYFFLNSQSGLELCLTTK